MKRHFLRGLLLFFVSTQSFAVSLVVPNTRGEAEQIKACLSAAQIDGVLVSIDMKTRDYTIAAVVPNASGTLQDSIEIFTSRGRSLPQSEGCVFTGKKTGKVENNASYLAKLATQNIVSGKATTGAISVCANVKNKQFKADFDAFLKQMNIQAPSVPSADASPRSSNELTPDGATPEVKTEAKAGTAEQSGTVFIPE